MSIPSDIGGVPNVGDPATRITVQQSLGGAFAGVGEAESSKACRRLKPSMPSRLKYNGIHDIVRELNAISGDKLGKYFNKFVREDTPENAYKSLGRTKVDRKLRYDKIIEYLKKASEFKPNSTSFKKIEKFKSFLSSIPTERLKIEEELEPAGLEQKGTEEKEAKERRKPRRARKPVVLEPLPVPPLLGTLEASAGDEEKAQVNEENAVTQAQYEQQYIEAVAKNAGKVDEEKMRTQLAGAGVRDKSSQDLLIQRQVLKNLGLPEQDAEKKETDYNREQLLADLKPRQLLDDNVLLPLQPNRMSDGGPSFRYGSELQTNLETQKRIMAGTKIISRNVVEHFQPQRQKLIEKMIETKDVAIKNIDLAKISEEERAELSIEKQVLIPQSQSLGYTVTDPNMTRRGPMEYANYGFQYVGGWN